MRFNLRSRTFYLPLLLLAGSCNRLDTVELLLDCESPAGENLASFYRIYGGGAAGWQLLRVSIRANTQPFDADSFVFQMTHGYDVRMQWQGEHHLRLQFPSEARVDSVVPVLSIRELVRIDTASAPSTGGQLSGGSTCASTSA